MTVLSSLIFHFSVPYFPFNHYLNLPSSENDNYQMFFKNSLTLIWRTQFLLVKPDLTNDYFLISTARLAGVHLSVEDIALTSMTQIRKLELILGELDKRLGLQDSNQTKWNVKRESCSWLGFNNEATSEQMFCPGTNFELQQDLVLAQGCHVSLHQLWGILEKIKFADITRFCFNHLSINYPLVLCYESKERPIIICNL